MNDQAIKERVYIVWASGEFCLEEDREEFSTHVRCRKKPIKVWNDTPLQELEKHMPRHMAIQFIRETR